MLVFAVIFNAELNHKIFLDLVPRVLLFVGLT